MSREDRLVRMLLENPRGIAQAAGFDVEHSEELVSRYGVQVLYGNTIRDLDAAQRSFETQLPISGRVNPASLTGKTALRRFAKFWIASPSPRSGSRIGFTGNRVFDDVARRRY